MAIDAILIRFFAIRRIDEKAMARNRCDRIPQLVQATEQEITETLRIEHTREDPRGQLFPSR